jgi:hypothetical protein
MKQLLLLLVLCQPFMSAAKSANIWPSIPFVRGLDECAYNQAYSQTRLEYMDRLTSMASNLMESGAKGSEALQMLVTFDAMYDKNARNAVAGKYMEVTLENTLKAYLDGYYRNLDVINKNITFRHINSIQRIIRDASNGQRTGYLPENTFDYLDYVAYGSYTLAPNCRGNVSVTLTLVDRDGYTKSYHAINKPSVVMSEIASRMFEDFQRTSFPSKVKIRNRTMTLLGAPNGSIGTANDPQRAQYACEDMGGRLPKERELESLSYLGDWNGGVSINRAVWAITYGNSTRVYHPGLMNPSPVRRISEVNSRNIKYYCVK